MSYQLPKLAKQRGPMLECIVCKQLSKDKFQFNDHLTQDKHVEAVNQVKQRALEKKRQQQMQQQQIEQQKLQEQREKEESMKRKPDQDIQDIFEMERKREELEEKGYTPQQIEEILQGEQVQQEENNMEIQKKIQIETEFDRYKKQQEQQEDMKKLQQEIILEEKMVKEKYLEEIKEHKKQMPEFVDDSEFKKFKNELQQEENEEVQSAKNLIANLRNKFKKKQ